MSRLFASRARLLIVCAVGAAAIGAVVSEAGVVSQFGGSENNAPEGKAEVQARVDQVMKEGREKAKGHGGKPANPKSLRPAPTPDPHVNRPGLVPVSPPFSPGQYLLDDMGWQERRGNRLELVYVGALASEPTQGIVVIAETNLPPDNPSANDVREDQGLAMKSRVVRTPARVGPVEIVSVAGHVLTLATSDGSRRFRFDATSEKFVSDS